MHKITTVRNDHLKETHRGYSHKIAWLDWGEKKKKLFHQGIIQPISWKIAKLEGNREGNIHRWIPFVLLLLLFFFLPDLLSDILDPIGIE